MSRVVIGQPLIRSIIVRQRVFSQAVNKSVTLYASQVNQPIN